MDCWSPERVSMLNLLVDLKPQQQPAYSIEQTVAVANVDLRG